ncbi:MAG: D-aminoacyl-tRNA deacylase [Chloroflexota bacterium]|nr:D-aminoacyl-tRNA deacylase [Chloroflexota bacterium]
MRAVVQRVAGASVTVEGKVVGEIGPGLAILVGITHGDTEAEASYLARKIANLRIFTDAEGKLNLSALEVRGSVLVVSQFTLYADCRKGRRPSFSAAARPEIADPLIECFIEFLRAEGLAVESGQFQAEMLVRIFNDGPVTIILDTQEIMSKR